MLVTLIFSMNIQNLVYLYNLENYKSKVYIKINIDSQTIFSNPERSYNYCLPNENNYDYKKEKDPILNSFVINIDDFPKINKEENKFIRALFVVQLLPKMYYDDLKSRAKIKVSPRNE